MLYTDVSLLSAPFLMLYAHVVRGSDNNWLVTAGVETASKGSNDSLQ
jgi:hypothetical protein